MPFPLPIEPECNFWVAPPFDCLGKSGIGVAE